VGGASCFQNTLFSHRVNPALPLQQRCAAAARQGASGTGKRHSGFVQRAVEGRRQLHCCKRDAETALLLQRHHVYAEDIFSAMASLGPRPAATSALAAQGPGQGDVAGSGSLCWGKGRGARLACGRLRGSSPVLAGSHQPGLPPEPAGLGRGQSHCPPPLCASPARLAAAFLRRYCCQFCREQEQSTVLALKDTADKRTSVRLVNGKNLVWPLLGNKAFCDGFYFTFCAPCLLSALQGCF